MIKNIFITKNRYFEVDCIGFYWICQMFWLSVLNSLTFYKISSNIQSICFAISSFAETKSVLFNSNSKLTAKFEKTIQKQSLKSFIVYISCFIFIYIFLSMLDVYRLSLQIIASKSSLITNHFLTVKFFIIIWNKEFISHEKSGKKYLHFLLLFITFF